MRTKSGDVVIQFRAGDRARLPYDNDRSSPDLRTSHSMLKTLTFEVVPQQPGEPKCVFPKTPTEQAPPPTVDAPSSEQPEAQSSAPPAEAAPPGEPAEVDQATTEPHHYGTHQLQHLISTRSKLRLAGEIDDFQTATMLGEAPLPRIHRLQWRGRAQEVMQQIVQSLED